MRVKNFIIGLVAVCLCVSCGMNREYIKRRYVKGYYVAQHKAPQGTLRSRDAGVAPTAQTFFPEEQVLARGKAVAAGDADIALPSPGKARMKSRRDATHTPLVASLAHEPTLDRSFRKPSAQLKALQPVQSRDGYSLLWIVILVIVILWLLGFLSGSVGGLIHLLLVVALILLILWLLRII